MDWINKPYSIPIWQSMFDEWILNKQTLSNQIDKVCHEFKFMTEYVWMWMDLNLWMDFEFFSMNGFWIIHNRWMDFFEFEIQQWISVKAWLRVDYDDDQNPLFEWNKKMNNFVF